MALATGIGVSGFRVCDFAQVIPNGTSERGTHLAYNTKYSSCNSFLFPAPYLFQKAGILLTA